MILSTISVILATLLPPDFSSSVAVAWFTEKPDERGRATENSEKDLPERILAFATAADEFSLVDPSIRQQNLKNIEIEFRGKRYPAIEYARIERPDTLVLKTTSVIDGVKPLVFDGTISAKKLCFQLERGFPNVTVKPCASNENFVVNAVTGVCRRECVANTLYLDAKNRPVWLDFGGIREVSNSEIACGGLGRPPAGVRLAPDSRFRRTQQIEAEVAASAVSVVIHLESRAKEDNTRRLRILRSRDDEDANEIDAVGYTIGGRLLVPTKLDGERIARMNRAEATLPDGTKTGLDFAGAMTDWNVLIFDFPKGTIPTPSFELSERDFMSIPGDRAWQVFVENENGRIVATAMPQIFTGIEVIRGGEIVCTANNEVADSNKFWLNLQDRENAGNLILDDSGRLVTIELERRFSASRWFGSNEPIALSTLRRMIAGSEFNPELRPRGENERNRLVWLGTETVKLTDALAREKSAQSFHAKYDEALVVTEVYANSPAAAAGIIAGDILLAVRRGTEKEHELEGGFEVLSSELLSAIFESDSSFALAGRGRSPWPDVENKLNRQLTEYGAGATVIIIGVRDGERKEFEVRLAPAPVHFANARKIRNRALGVSIKDMTFEVRRFFNFDENFGAVVIAKVRPGSPAAVAGLRPYELITEIDGDEIRNVEDLAEKIKGRTDITLTIRRLAQTRMVKIHIDVEEK